MKKDLPKKLNVINFEDVIKLNKEANAYKKKSNSNAPSETYRTASKMTNFQNY